MKLLVRDNGSELCQPIRRFLEQQGDEFCSDAKECEAVLWFCEGEKELLQTGEEILSQMNGETSLLLVMPYLLWESDEAEERSEAGAVLGAAGAWSRRYAPKGIRVNCLRYGVLAGEPVPEWVALERGAAPEEIARAVRFFLKEGTGFLTGQIIDVNGGRVY